MTPPELILAYALDLLLGDPQRFPHPVRLIGKWIGLLERMFRRTASSPAGLRLCGVFLFLLVCGGAFLATASLLEGAKGLAPGLGMALSVYLAYAVLATRDLHLETRRVLKAVEGGDLPRARKELSFLVGRDTARLDGPEILRALVETVAENISDGIVAPLFYLALGGPPLAMAYKALNTLDSMVGYRNERYLHLGWASARLDDLANFFPARLSAFFIVLSAFLLRRSGRESLAVLRRDHGKHPSPNSAWPEAAMAGALGVRLGGLNYYFGQPSPKPLIGQGGKGLEVADVRRAWKILYLASFFGLLLSLLLLWANPFLRRLLA